MARLKALNPEESGEAKELFDAVKGKLGMVPNMMRTMGNSPTVLNAYLGFNAGLSNASIGNKLGELIALAVATENGCDYCNSAHTFIGGKLGLSTEAIDLARNGESEDKKIEAALKFAKEILHAKGKVSDATLQAVKDAGYDDGAISEIIAKVALSIFTNYFNNVAETAIDFPKIKPIYSTQN